MADMDLTTWAELREGHGGQLPAYAWPGGYPLFYLCADGACLCPACVNDASNDAGPHRDDDASWRIVAYDTHDEGPPIVCAHCNGAIFSSYGDPDCPVCAGEGVASSDCPACGA